jgi:hypothetical protein
VALISRAAEVPVPDTLDGSYTVFDIHCEAIKLLPLLRERKAPAKRLPGESKAAKRERRRAEHREETAAIRKAVFERAGGRCEAWMHEGGPERCCRPAVVLDHWLGGVGRKREQQSVETCWALCEDCNRDRTASYPDADWWNTSWWWHCREYDHPFQPHIVKPHPGAGARETEGR